MENQESQARQISVPSKELISILGALQLASTRGAYRPEEFVEIGSAYQSLYQFLTDIGAIAPPTPATEPAQQPGTASG